ncbi:MAG: GNAT family N-acetyltransferase [Clostridiaceae bacterium]|nr:GNAT family N-acetyltransferase [Clostridiaceae bacterium]
MSLCCCFKIQQKAFGGCNLSIPGNAEAEIGWILHIDYWKQGYGTEMGKCLVEFGFKKICRRNYMHNMLPPIPEVITTKFGQQLIPCVICFIHWH